MANLKSAVLGSPRLVKTHNHTVGRNRVRDRGARNVLEVGTAVLQRSSVTFLGDDNTVSIGSSVRLVGVSIVVRGSGHRLRIGDGCRFTSTEFAFEDHGCTIEIGEGTTGQGGHLAAAEDGSAIHVGDDCMFSSDIYIATTDSHSIVDRATGTRTNPAADVRLGDHVWLGRGVQVVKGTTLGADAIVGGGSVVTRDVPPGCLVVGVPARVVREGVTWLRERVPVAASGSAPGVPSAG